MLVVRGGAGHNTMMACYTNSTAVRSLLISPTLFGIGVCAVKYVSATILRRVNDTTSIVPYRCNESGPLPLTNQKQIDGSRC